MISSASQDSFSRLVADRPMCLATALDKACENIDCMIAILSCQTKNRFYESTQRLIQLRRVLWVALQASRRVVAVLAHRPHCHRACHCRAEVCRARLSRETHRLLHLADRQDEQYGAGPA